ncbi:hypothetical protein ANN_02837 [Periplaneta americana]|uniref:Uncharacterized protein n=1 Tax=Periplaneta americana TaxID=6978 RepID=A0ABQ8TXF4_PERAM|nr:hypothetical protein ANN_02837 [Periplaneta americana]
MILKDMLLELNDICEQYGMKLNENKMKTMVVARKINKVTMLLVGSKIHELKFRRYILAGDKILSMARFLSLYTLRWVTLCMMCICGELCRVLGKKNHLKKVMFVHHKPPSGLKMNIMSGAHTLIKKKVVKLFSELSSANTWIIKKQGLSSSEWRDVIKMTAIVAPVRALPGRSTGTSHCRHFSESKSLPHVLGKCPRGEMSTIKRHNVIRSLLAAALRNKGWEVYEEVHCLADQDSVRRIDTSPSIGEIIDPTIRFEQSKAQPKDVDKEGKEIYESAISYFRNKYNVQSITVTGLLLGSRGTVPKMFVTWKGKYKLGKDIQDEIIQNII